MNKDEAPPADECAKDDDIGMSQAQEGPPSYSSMPHMHHQGSCKCSLRPVQLAAPNSAASPNDVVSAVVVTICDGGSYDKMFTSVPQEGLEGTRVAVYQTSSDSLKPIRQGIQGLPVEGSEEIQQMVSQLVADINAVDADCVVFNWECCGGCSDSGFPTLYRGDVLELISCLLEKGCMVMASDFSLKALIKDWDAGLLGPNPFKKLGGFSDSFKIHFDPAVLTECPSSQLQKVGELCADKAQAVLSAMSDTIVYTVDPSKTGHGRYELEVLTIVTEMNGFSLTNGLPHDMRCTIGAQYGAAGHVLLKYPTGGTILTSAGHWLELANVDLSLDNLRAAWSREYGEEKTVELMARCTDERASSEERSSRMQGYAQQLVQQSAPCMKMSSKYF